MHSNDSEMKTRQFYVEDMAKGVKSDHIYEDIDLSKAPPKLAPSGVCTQGKTVLKPIAFKPVLTSSAFARFGTPGTGSPFSSIDSTDNANNAMNKKLSQSQYSLSQHSFFLEDDNWYSEVALKLAQTPQSIDERVYDLTTQTPSDSVELESILREKDSEISYLRETLEHNEQVIFKVYEEKEQSWRKEFNKLRSIYEMKLRTSEQKLLKAEQNQHIERKNTETEKQSHDETKSTVKQLEKELSLLRCQLEETEWSLCAKIGEISLLKAQLKESQDEQSLRLNELISIKTKLKDTKSLQKSQQVFDEKLSNSHQNSFFTDKNMESLRNHLTKLLSEREDKSNVIKSLKNENSKLQDLVTFLQNELDNNKQQIEEEKTVWFEEKEIIIKYQKQLQLNYMQMFKKNKSLEHQLRSDEQKHFNESQC